jgi:hypothetical protein
MVKDAFTKSWIIENAEEVLEEYSDGITIRQLHYRLVARGMTNDVQHYKRVVVAMTDARWDGTVDMESFIDRERAMSGETKAEEKSLTDEIENAKEQIGLWMTQYRLSRWSNQPEYIEVWIEKKALQGVFEGECLSKSVGLAPCKGYPSLTFLNDAAGRFKEAQERGQDTVILYFGDYDPSGEDIPRSIEANLSRMGCEVEVERMALTPEQIDQWNLPGVPAKLTDSRSATWDGAGAVELDAIEPSELKKLCNQAIDAHFDRDLYADLKETEEEEKKGYQEALKAFVASIQ